MKNFENFLNESYPETINIQELSNKMSDDARELWQNKLEELFLNKLVFFTGSKWLTRHSWDPFLVTVKQIFVPAGLSLFSSEFCIKDTEDKIYTVLRSEPIKIYNSIEDFKADEETKKYNL